MGASRPEGDEGTQLWFNGEPFHIGAAAIARWQTALLRQITNDSSASVNARNQPVGSQSENAAMLLVFRESPSGFLRCNRKRKLPLLLSIRRPTTRRSNPRAVFQFGLRPCSLSRWHLHS